MIRFLIIVMLMLFLIYPLIFPRYSFYTDEEEKKSPAPKEYKQFTVEELYDLTFTQNDTF